VLVIIPQVWGISVIVFVLIRLIPGDPAYLFAGGTASQEQIAAVRHRLALDQSIPVQYGIYVKNFLHGDMGRSLVTSHPVADDILNRLPATLELITFALLVCLLVGIPLGALGARKPGGIADRLTGGYGLIAGSLPDFWWGLMLIFILFTVLHIVPAPVGQLDLGLSPSRSITHFYVIDALLAGEWDVFISACGHILLPGLTLAFVYGGPIVKHTRTSMTTVLNAPYLVYGAMCGLSRAVLFRYALRNALLPALTMTGLTYVYLISGAVLIETVFSWGGLGQYAVQAITSSDYAAVSGMVLVTTVLALLIYLALDIVYALIDPRIRYG
jgi:ABC-type dipeptide/oligopeptide/nickel transport system permease component